MCYTWLYFCWKCREVLQLVYVDCPTPYTCGNRRTDVGYEQGGRLLVEKPIERGMQCAVCARSTNQKQKWPDNIAEIPVHNLDNWYLLPDFLTAQMTNLKKSL